MAAIGDVYRLTLVASWNTEPILNTMSFQLSAIGTGDERNALIAAWQATVQPSWLACFTVNYLLQQYLVQAVKPVGTVFAINVANLPGTVGGNDNVSQAAVIMTRKTATPGRGGRGRLFMGPVPLAFTGVTNPDINTTTNYLALANNLIVNLTNTGWTFVPVLFSRKASTARIITAWNISTRVKTRRSRAIATRFHRRKRHTVGSI